ncbi:DUF397 domain-containing protein [Streptomyces morookaense]|uniref:DUF397 domain-containing protein n=1 Tax=Streptomyces morookaense TaxID=1970 RepID=A0A7Y7EA81_STRMO|nr:DUF397 domain-containing protein [Streptomyces morookaense]NVK81211.1 DUF397 domain-containing protein [Streptomyces morookaense]GHF30531.1 hypothetical protein GCM10010359_35790 [Streptomyces morookaense]
MTANKHPESWFKSSHSGDNNGGGCISVAALPGHVGIRDSKNTARPPFAVPITSWAAFITEVKAGRLD